jgi:uncharacterized membrane protein YtjA (UPF0391 family)
MPMVISLVCAIAGDPGMASAAAIAAADRKAFFIVCSLVMLVRSISADCSALLLGDAGAEVSPA